MSYDPVAQAAMLREEVTLYEAASNRLDAILGFDEDGRAKVAASKATFLSIVEDMETGEINDPDEARRIVYEAMTKVREVRENFEMIADRLGPRDG